MALQYVNVLKFLASFTLQDSFLKGTGAISLKCNHEERLNFSISQILWIGGSLTSLGALLRIFFSLYLKKFFFPFIFISWNYFTILYWFLPYIDMNHPWIYMCSPSQPPSRLPLHPIPLGLPSSPALSTCLMRPTWAGDLFHPR